MKKLCMKAAATVLLSSIAVTAIAQVINVPETIQEHDQWCWAAVCAAILNAKQLGVSQCTIAEYARTHATWHDFGKVDCCADPSQGCNYWNYNWGSAGSIQDILQNWGIENYGINSSLTIESVANEINENRPFVIRWGWATGGGHFLVGHGLEGTSMYYMNPWFGEGPKIAEYSWVVSGANHTWTSTNLLTTSLPIQLASFSVHVLPHGLVGLEWTTLSEMNNYGFFVQRRLGTTGNFTEILNSFIPGHSTTLEPHHYSFTDSSLAGGTTWLYRLRQMDLDGTERFTDPISLDVTRSVAQNQAPTYFNLEQNYPNPFNPTTNFEFRIPKSEFVSLKVYDILGREVAVLVNERKAPGSYSVTWNASGMASGVYFYRLSAGSFLDVKKLMLLR